MASHIVWDVAGDPRDPCSESIAETEPSQHEGSSSIREPDLSEQCGPKNSHVVWSKTNSLLRRFGAIRVEQGSSCTDQSSGSLARGSSSEEPSQQSKLSRGSSRRSASVPPPRTVRHSDEAVPLNEQGVPTSVGSAGHHAGTCKPCTYLASKRECRNGINCTFCHFPHKRKSAGRRGRLRKYMERAEVVLDDDPSRLGAVTEKLPRFIDQDEKRKSDVVSKLMARASKAVGIR